MTLTPLPPETITRLGLPLRPPWLKQFYGLPPDRPWRDDPALAGRFHAQDPDDLEVTFFFPAAAEHMWVRTTAHAPAIGGYEGELLNTPFATGTGLATGAQVAYRVPTGAIGPVWVSPAVRSNLEHWSAKCDSCGFDLLLEPAKDIIARQFPTALFAPYLESIYLRQMAEEGGIDPVRLAAQTLDVNRKFVECFLEIQVLALHHKFEDIAALTTLTEAAPRTRLRPHHE